MSSRLPTVEEDTLLEDEEVLTEQTTGAGAASVVAAPAASGVQALAEMFPQHSRTAVEEAVAANPGNLDAAAAFLAISGDSSPPDPATISAAEEADLQLARAMQAAESRRRSTRARYTTPAARHLQGMVGVLRDIIVPALHAHFRELKFDDVAERSGTVRYGMRDVRVVALSLPPENIIVRVVGRQVRVQVVNMFLQIGVAHWNYESTGFLPLQDAGKMEASLNGLGAVVHLNPREGAQGRVSVTVGECEVAVEGSVRIKAEGTAADWAYNTMAMLFKPLIVSYIKESVGDLVRVSLASQLRDWTYTIEREEEPVPTVPSIDPLPQQVQAPTDSATTAA